MSRIACLLALLVAAATARPDDFDEAIRLLATGQTLQGITALRAVAGKGDLRAQRFLGKILLGTKLNQPDYPEALKWLRLASEQGSGEAAWLVGDMFAAGRGLSQDQAEADRWYEKAARQGWDQQEIAVFYLRWDPSAGGPLRCQEIVPQIPCPPPAAMSLLLSTGLAGVLTPDGGGVRNRSGPKAQLYVIAQRPIAAEVRLKQPRHTVAAWVQQDAGWKLYPAGAPLLDREVILAPTPDPRVAFCQVRDVDGSLTGGACLGWH